MSNRAVSRQELERRCTALEKRIVDIEHRATGRERMVAKALLWVWDVGMKRALATPPVEPGSVTNLDVPVHVLQGIDAARRTPGVMTQFGEVAGG